MTSRDFTEWLHALIRGPLPEPADKEAWFLRQKPYLDAMNNADLRIDAGLFHFVHHYVADADIRRRDPSYRKAQDAAMRRYLESYVLNDRGADE
jgi:hypothetical protein